MGPHLVEFGLQCKWFQRSFWGGVMPSMCSSMYLHHLPLFDGWKLFPKYVDILRRWFFSWFVDNLFMLEYKKILRMEEIRLTTWYGISILYRVSYMLGGAGFLPSTVSPWITRITNPFKFCFVNKNHLAICISDIKCQWFQWMFSVTPQQITKHFVGTPKMKESSPKRRMDSAYERENPSPK